MGYSAVPRVHGLRWLTLGLLLLACDSRSLAMDSLAEIGPPLGSLNRISLWMTARDLLEARPGLKAVPYVGYVDSIGEWAVHFEFGNRSNEFDIPAPTEELGRVSALSVPPAVLDPSHPSRPHFPVASRARRVLELPSMGPAVNTHSTFYGAGGQYTLHLCAGVRWCDRQRP